METPYPNPPQPAPSPSRSPRGASALRTKLGIVGLSGVLFAGAIVGLTSLASAQDTGDRVAVAGADAESVADAAPGDQPDEHGVEIELLGDEDGLWFDVELSPEDEALYERFEACLTDAGLEELEPSEAELEAGVEPDDMDWEKIDSIFEQCEPILEDLSGDGTFVFGGEVDFDGLDLDDLEDFEGHIEGFFEMSPEDEAVLERFDACLTEAGFGPETLDADDDAELTDEQVEQLDQAFEGCESILDELSEGGGFILDFEDFEGCEDDDDDDDADDDADEPSDIEESVNA